MMSNDPQRISDTLWEIPRHGGMRVPARLYISERMLSRVLADKAPQQAVNVAHLPGIVGASLAMPDIHWGYGFPIGGVAAFDLDEGIVSPGGVGYDINCGVRLMASRLTADDIRKDVGRLTEALFRSIPAGVGASGAIRLSRKELQAVARSGAGWMRDRDYATDGDIAHIEENGCIPEADPAQVSERAWTRAADQLGTLGSGNHFLEIDRVTEIYDPDAARAYGLSLDQVTLTIHCGSRGFGHQVCDDFLAVMDRAARRFSIDLPDRQLACAPVRSDEGQAYLGAMRCAVNYAFANRQLIAHNARRAFARALNLSDADASLRTVYEVAHNIAKLETHTIGGETRRLCVHRKGATRAFGPSRPEVPSDYRSVGQPVLVPGDMGRCSFVLAGTDRSLEETFGSTCHGAGRRMSRSRAVRSAKGRDIRRELADRGIVVQARNRRTLAEEMPEAYKDVSDVVAVCEAAGISRMVAKLEPLGCIKG